MEQNLRARVEEAFDQTLDGDIVAITIYGSHARGYHTDGSDIDAFVIYHGVGLSILKDIGCHRFSHDGLDITAIEFEEYLRRMAECDPWTVFGSLGVPVYHDEGMELLMLQANQAVTTMGAVEIGNKLLSGVKVFYGFGSTRIPSIKEDIHSTYALGFVEDMLASPAGLVQLPSIHSNHPIIQAYINKLVAGERVRSNNEEYNMIGGHCANLKAMLDAKPNGNIPIKSNRKYNQYRGSENPISMHLVPCVHNYWSNLKND